MGVPHSARKDGTNYVYCKAPDVCKTPMGSSMVPVPYMSVAFFGTSARTSRTVRNNGKQDFQLNSRATVTTGHEPGTGKGVNVAGHVSHSHVKAGHKTVYSEGYSVIRDGDPALINRPGPGGTEPRRSRFKTTIKHI
ncbi:PAAR-like domain-containing protein [Pseudovibrio denitrificans]|uniref:DUF4150 domain-containing protein n=2 Tax=Pseudovibrio brasiliensis TaxID=1898042 RepID=A0ABX8AK07_9HYPH|nr:DUF4150 domain-containing protein [Pseudovibrio brasiliensis]